MPDAVELEQGVLAIVESALVLAKVPFILLDVPGTPGFKARHRSRIVFPKDKSKKPFVHEYPDPATAAYEKMLAEYAALVMRTRPPTERPVAVSVEVFKKIPESWSRRQYDDALARAILPITKPDWDNHGKIVDALKGIVWKDDSQVVDGHVYKRYAAKPSLRIEVREYIAP